MPLFGFPDGALRFISFAFAILPGLKLARGILADKLRGGNRLAKLNVHLWAKKIRRRSGGYPAGS
jgi:hypothetical protein